MPALQLRYALYVCALLAVAAVLATCYFKGRGDATTKTDLRVARETIKAEREAIKITHDINMRVNAEGIQTAQTAKAAIDEIQSVRRNSTASVANPVAGVADVLGPDDARILQLAREARAAAIRSSASVQPARAGAR